LLFAVHRFVILGEVADRLIWRVTLTYRRFASWLVSLSLPWLMPSVADALLGKHHQIVVVILSFLSLIFAAIISLRMMLLLPALAGGWGLQIGAAHGEVLEAMPGNSWALRWWDVCPYCNCAGHNHRSLAFEHSVRGR
jgi:hypothetical protein